MENRKLQQVILILAPLVASFAFALDIYLPAVPSLLKIFDTNQFTIQMTMSVFMLCMGCGQLLFGPLSDQIGRKKVLITSSVLFFIASLMCAFAKDIYTLIELRALQALGCCGMMVVGYAVVRDLYSGRESARVYSFLSASIGVSPMLAPVLGGYLIHWFDWRATFYFLSAYAFVCLFIVMIPLSETHKHYVKLDRHIFSRYKEILSNRIFNAFALTVACGIACLFTFFSMSAYILVELLNIPIQHFGYYFAVLGIVVMIGGYICGWIAPHLGTFKTNLLGTLLVFSAGLMMLVWYYINGLTSMGFVIPLIPGATGASFMIGAGTSGAMQPFEKMSGTAAALNGSIQFIFAFLVGTLVMINPVQSSLPMAYVFLILGFISFMVMVFIRKNVTVSDY